MSAACCGMCEYLGYRTCDACGGIAWYGGTGPDGQDLCAGCDPDGYAFAEAADEDEDAVEEW